MIEANNYQYLLVNLVIKPGRSVDFEMLMQSLMSVFEAPDPDGLGWKLLSAVKGPPNDKGEVDYIHLWQRPRDNILSDAMVLLGRNSDYYKLDQCKVSEVQDIFRVAGVYSPVDSDKDGVPTRGRSALASSQNAPLFIETVDAPADWFDLHDWQDAMSSIAASKEVRKQGSLLFAIQAETGKLRRFIHYWRPCAEAQAVAGNRGVGLKEFQKALAAQSYTKLQENLAQPKGGQSKPVPYPPSGIQSYGEVDYRALKGETALPEAAK